MVAAVQPFHYIHEREDAFLSLFPHRFDYIYAPYPAPGASPQWHTERRYPLSDRMVNQGNSLYGVRFSKTTQYALIDIDITSAYHPQRNPFAISQLLDALEPLGIVEAVRCTSSDSGGIHLYLPFAESCVSWKLAIALAHHLEKAGFAIKPGQLELFPNVRPFSAQLALFHAHRLPLQPGSYLLNEDFAPVWSSKARFVQHWHQAQQRNGLDLVAVERCVSKKLRSQRPVSNRAEKFLADLNLDIEQGWTGRGQTNHLLGRIALRTYVFHHILEGGEPLTGQALTAQIVAIAQSLPGYADWCDHQYEIEKRATEWTRCVEASRYFPYGVPNSDLNTQSELKNSTDVENSINRWNIQQEEKTREKIKQIVAELLDQDLLPNGITDRFKLLTSYGMGGSSLYRHKDLWHPNYMSTQISAEGVDRESSLLDRTDRNPLSSAASNRNQPNDPAQSTDRNSSQSQPLQTSSSVTIGGDRLTVFQRTRHSSDEHLEEFTRWSVRDRPPLSPEVHHLKCEAIPVENVSTDSS